MLTNLRAKFQFVGITLYLCTRTEMLSALKGYKGITWVEVSEGEHHISQYGRLVAVARKSTSQCFATLKLVGAEGPYSGYTIAIPKGMEDLVSEATPQEIEVLNQGLYPEEDLYPNEGREEQPGDRAAMNVQLAADERLMDEAWQEREYERMMVRDDPPRSILDRLGDPDDDLPF